ncbi:MAG TPA: 1-acyl-sn-glycerol-3-phosphate acyltransferase, partial [Gemmatimonadales bacterium]|nr:1-acyl-sn-glycerol-3-phosphate acyltransferase [Gemmatimonadales bacterium]
MPASPIVRSLARLACRVFYRVDTVGRPPDAGAALLLPNHPNALLDPAVIWATAGRDVRFLAKSTLFEGPLRFLVAGSGAIPVYRKLDQGADVSKNSAAFAAVDAALAAG